LKTDFFCGTFGALKIHLQVLKRVKTGQEHCENWYQFCLQMPVAKLSTTPNNEKRRAAFSWCNNPNGGDLFLSNTAAQAPRVAFPKAS